ncbi:26S proteasome regulatory subunit 8-like [Hondaea fermentalgiana]|uniref:vesicle-fusing ATPase n=1 Tax=Hondaea fermentalgiana TaxID=2315210 RepID=A0A2R5GTX8_9STRA|nr:26S proteasome regulatory subunit 8-like [Hondaea fermentalgiana]|eukprot:GBG33208.1 26S proteasome regulatory subunit 8-like [Hondaea fermentalgiana]
MTDNSSMIKQATATVAEAIKLDNEKEYAEAYAKYQRALEMFLVALKYEKNPRSKEILTKRVEGYMVRAEQLKEAIDAERDKPKAAAAVGNGGGAEDAEKSKLRGALASAIVTEKPNVSWDDVAGLDRAKAALKEAVILPTRFPQLFEGERRPWKGILLYGPPGTGKSYLAKAVATEADAQFFSVSSSDLVSKWQGESERLVRNLFEMAREARPAIIFIDEVDSLCGSRTDGENDSQRRIKTEFLVQMQGVGKDDKGLLVLGATNTPWSLDPAMRRRFEKRVYISLPEKAARKRLFELCIGETEHTMTRQDLDSLAEMTEGYSGADVSIAVREALMRPLRICQEAKQFKVHPDDGMYEPVPLEETPNCSRCPPQTSKSKKKRCDSCGAVFISLYDVEPDKLFVPPVKAEDFFYAVENSNTSVSQSELGRFDEWTAEFGQDG